MADIPHFAWPFTRAGAHVNVVEQDTADHVMSCEHVIVRCPVGWREDRPEFGIPWPEFHTAPLDLSGIEGALARFEPRGNANAYEYADVASAAIRNITIEIEA